MSYKVEFNNIGVPEKQLYVTEYKLNENLKYNELLIEVIFFPINPADLLLVEGKYATPPISFPAPLGAECVAKVLKVGKKVKIFFVKDRPGHDFRYALNSNKIKYKLGWQPKTNFRQGIRLTFDWYNNNKVYYKSLSKKDIIERLGKG